MNKKIVGFIGALAILAPVGASAMPAAPVAAPQTTIDGAKLDRVVVVVRTGPVVRRGFVGRPLARPFVRRGFVGRPGVGVRVGPRGGVGVRIR